eukprot:jgi/Bigna1/144538/aug1.88_g19246
MTAPCIVKLAFLATLTLTAGVQNHGWYRTREGRGESLPKIHVLDAAHDYAGAKTPLHIETFKELRRLSVSDATTADFIFVDVDTLMQKFWPVYLKTSVTKHHPSILDDDDDKAHLWKEQVFKDTAENFIQGHGNFSGKFVYFYDIKYKEGEEADPVRRERVREQFAEFSVFVGNDIVKNDTRSAVGVNILPPINKYLARTTKMTERGERGLLATFRGRACTDKGVRKQLFHDMPVYGENVDLVDTFHEDGPLEDLIASYKNSSFAFAPRGTKPYSFRPGEAMTFGAIPVIIVDDVEPIRPGNWEDWAVIIPEKDTRQSIATLQHISEAKRKTMFQAGREMARCVNTIPGYVNCMLKALHEIQGIST